MKKLLLVLLVTFMVTGCSNWEWPGKRIPEGNKGTAEQGDSETKKVYGSIEGDFELPEFDGPELEVDGEMIRPQMKVRIDGVDMELPAGTKGKFKMSASGKTNTSSFTTIASEWKLNSAPVQLFVFGGIMVAVGGVLIFFGMWKLGIASIISGFSLIGCGIMINQYPWIVLVVIGLGFIAGVVFIWTQYHKKKAHASVDDQEYVLSKLSHAISKMPEEMVDKYIKDPLRKDDKSDLIREITRKARGLNS
jgi:hypothetical protein